MTEITNKTLYLYRIWQICNKLSEKQSDLEGQDIFVSLLGNRSMFYNCSFEHFLEYYSFKVEKEGIMVFNDDGIPYESYNNNDFSYISKELLEMSDEDLDKLIDEEVEKQLIQQRLTKLVEKENIKSQIERLQRQLEL
jgi:hypothetical protein